MTAVAVQHARPRPVHRRVGGVLVDAVLWVCAAAGLLCVLAALAAHLFGFHLVLFSTGSMSPTILTGSVALVHQTPADRLQVGQVVTVTRTGELPITHRVVAIDPVPGRTDARSLTLRGDANPVADPKPYQVTSAGVVVASVPGGAHWVVAAGRRQVMLAAGLLAACLVVFAFWPRRPAARS